MLFTIRLFMIATNHNGTSVGQYLEYENCKIDVRSDTRIEFTDVKGKKHYSNLYYEIIEQ